MQRKKNLPHLLNFCILEHRVNFGSFRGENENAFLMWNSIASVLQDLGQLCRCFGCPEVSGSSSRDARGEEDLAPLSPLGGMILSLLLGDRLVCSYKVMTLTFRGRWEQRLLSVNLLFLWGVEMGLRSTGRALGNRCSLPAACLLFLCAVCKARCPSSVPPFLNCT